MTHNPFVPGSSPGGPTIFPFGENVRASRTIPATSIARVVRTALEALLPKRLPSPWWAPAPIYFKQDCSRTIRYLTENFEK
jgi:hypothetical protein